MSRARYLLFVAITVLSPFLLLGAVELVLRVTWSRGAVPLFVTAPDGGNQYLIGNPFVTSRFFSQEGHPPTLVTDPFARVKPAHAFRVFVLGESSAAGFPYPRNGSFPRLLRDMLRDVLPGDSVEVVNLGIPATNSYAMLDFTNEVVRQHPDVVLIYAGHNEYYGALGVGSTERVGSSPAVVRMYLGLEHLRTFMLLRVAMLALWHRFEKPAPVGPAVASFMETVARDQQITLGGRAYEQGVQQFEGNLDRIVDRLHDAGVPVFLASIVSNLRDMHPFASPANAGPGNADAVFDSAQRAFAARDSLRAGSMFRQARDLDVVRFRAPTEFNAVIRRVAQRPGVTYVPVAEAFAAASPGGIVGHELILEHLHPNQQGYALIARQFFDALHAANFLGHSAQMERLRPWDAYVAGMELTPFDRRIVEHTVNSVTGRWPFVPAGQDRDYRGTYHAVGMLDSLALLVSRGGMAWPVAKMELARDYERRQFPDSALAEYRGLMRDLPLAELPYELAGHVLIEMKRGDEALPLLQHAWGLQHTAYVAFTLGTMAAQHRDFPQAASYLTEASRLKPDDPDILYQLSLALALSRDLAGARLAAQRVAQLAPGYPGLAQWLQTLGQGAP